MDNLLAKDLDHILANTQGLWEELRGRRVFITGGTGFFGCWLLESFLWANEKLRLNAAATVLSRNPESFKQKAPHLATAPSVTLHQGDIRDFDFSEGHFSHIIHAATGASATLNDQNPLLMFDTIVQGTRRALDFAIYCGAEKFLLTSSGAVYGKQPPEMTHIPEDYCGAPDPADPGSAYGEGKRAAELLCAIYSSKHKLECKIARCFAFVGPYLPLGLHFAVGNFIRDGLNGGPIQVNGDGTPYRSYLYSADLAIWLWTILCKGKSCRPYNIGSENDLTIAEVANTVASVFDPPCEVSIAKKEAPDAPAQKYTPSTQRARADLGLKELISLSDAVKRTIQAVQDQ